MQIKKIMNECFLYDYDFIKTKLRELIQIIKLSDSNLSFFYLDLGKYNKDINLINKLFNQSVCLSKYCNLYNKKKIIIIWLPIDTKRDYEYSIINQDNLKLSIDNFKAFTASGVTFGENPRITIISRYEEISKLLFHELIHNYNIDGSSFHEHNDFIIKKYTKIKNSKKNTIMNYDYPYSIYESYTELMSSYFNMIFRNINVGENKIKKVFTTEILLELLYSYNTVSNLIKLNGYKNYEDFEKEISFKGNICIYEYYYLKALMYNNYEIKLCNDIEDFQKNYINIININKKDHLLKNIFNNMKTHSNFRYVLYQ
jgi:hypothetical protein